MQSNKRWYILAGVILALGCPHLSAAQAMMKGIIAPPANVRPIGLMNVGIEQHLNAKVPLDLPFVNEDGKAVRLGDYFGKKPVVLDLAYFNCTMLCGEVMNGLAGSLKAITFDAGKEFEVLTVSFDPKDTPALATEKKKTVLARYDRKDAALGWHFLTGKPEAINALTKAVGFQYEYDSKMQQFAHAASIIVLTPEGKIAQYFYGIEFAPKDLRLGLVEASQNKIGNVVDQALLYCYHYDPATGKYGAIVANVMRLAGGATILILGSFLLFMFRHDPQRKALQVK